MGRTLVLPDSRRATAEGEDGTTRCVSSHCGRGEVRRAKGTFQNGRVPRSLSWFQGRHVPSVSEQAHGEQREDERAIRESCSWAVSTLATVPVRAQLGLRCTGVCEQRRAYRVTDAVRAVARESPRLQGAIDIQDFNARAAGQPIVDDAPRQSNALTASRRVSEEMLTYMHCRCCWHSGSVVPY